MIRYHSYVESLKKKGGRFNQTYLQDRNGISDVENKLMATGGEGERVGADIYM